MSISKKRQRPKKLGTDQMDQVFNQKDYSEYFGKRGRRAAVWEHFLRRKDGLKAKCKLCKDKDIPLLVPTADNNTSGLKRHLKKAHNMRLNTPNSDEDEELSAADEVRQGPSGQSTKKASITDYMKPVKEDSLESQIAELAAKDGVPFDTISKSGPLRKLFSKSQYGHLPLSHNTVRDIVMRYGENIKAKKTEELQELKKKGDRFSMTLDEWTSKNNKRYLNVNVNYKNSKCINLGLARIKDSFTSQDCLDLVIKRLTEFGLDLPTDIVASTNDGASVMQKHGVLSAIINQKCMTHGIQLAVVDAFYDKVTESRSQLPKVNQSTDNSPNSDEESEAEEQSDEDRICANNAPSTEAMMLKDINVRVIIEKIRKIVRIFRKSPLKNSVLQEQILADKEEIQRPRKLKVTSSGLQLILDCKVRWTSLYAMCQRYQDVQSSIEKALVELKNDKRFKQKLSKIEALTADEKDILEELVESLGAVKDAVEEISAEDSNLLNFEETFDVLQKTLQNMDSDFGTKLAWKINARVLERRTDWSEVLYTLHHGFADESSSDDEDSNRFAETINANSDLIISLRRLQDHSYALLQRLLADQLQKYPDLDAEIAGPSRKRPRLDASNCNALEPGISVREKMRRRKILVSANACKSTADDTHSQSLRSLLSQELHAFVESGPQAKRGFHLQLVYDYLLSIRATSVQSERMFSLAGLFCTKICSRLSDDILDTLCFLKSHFISLQKA